MSILPRRDSEWTIWDNYGNWILIYPVCGCLIAAIIYSCHHHTPYLRPCLNMVCGIIRSLVDTQAKKIVCAISEPILSTKCQFAMAGSVKLWTINLMCISLVSGSRTLWEKECGCPWAKALSFHQLSWPSTPLPSVRQIWLSWKTP